MPTPYPARPELVHYALDKLVHEMRKTVKKPVGQATTLLDATVQGPLAPL